MTISWACAQKEQVINFKMNCVRNVHSTCGVLGVEYTKATFGVALDENYTNYLITTLGLKKCAAMTSFQDCLILKVHWMGSTSLKSS